MDCGRKAGKPQIIRNTLGRLAPRRGDLVTSAAVVVASTVGWPAIQLAVFWLRFDRLPPEGAAEGLVFAPMGFVAGLAAAILLARASSPNQKRQVGLGYLAASPIAFVGSLISGLGLAGIWGPLVFGAVPLAVGCMIGFASGRSEATA